MPRIKIDLPEKFIFTTEIAVRITDINYGGHVGNDSILSILQEARVQFFKSMNSSELDLFGTSVIMGDVAIVFKNESFYGDVLNIEIFVQDISKVSFDIFYLVTEINTKKEIARAKTGMVCFDYKNRKVTAVPDSFRKILEEK
ncbi:MAG TPA: thioesterase [Bacteroidetes bacterium]|nr:thioesterase [Bacteroidota bacterium]